MSKYECDFCPNVAHDSPPPAGWNEITAIVRRVEQDKYMVYERTFTVCPNHEAGAATRSESGTVFMPFSDFMPK